MSHPSRFVAEFYRFGNSIVMPDGIRKFLLWCADPDFYFTGPLAKLEDLKALAQTLRATAESGRLATQQADLIEKRAREKLEREQQDKLAAAGKRGEITPETLQQIRRQLYGLE